MCSSIACFFCSCVFFFCLKFTGYHIPLNIYLVFLYSKSLLDFWYCFETNYAWKWSLKLNLNREAKWYSMRGMKRGFVFWIWNNLTLNYPIPCGRKADVWNAMPILQLVGLEHSIHSVQYQHSQLSLLHLHGRFLSSFTHQYLFDLHQPHKLKVAALHLGQGWTDMDVSSTCRHTSLFFPLPSN